MSNIPRRSARPRPHLAAELSVCLVIILALSAWPARSQLWDPDIGPVILTANDDGSTVEITLPFPVSIYDATYTSFWINNNGNVTFTGPLSTYTAFAFPNSMGTVIVAGFFGDVDTRATGSGEVHYKALSDRVVITWDHVGYYSRHVDKLNTFQVIFTSSGLIGFSYDDLQWTTGDASGGSDGFGGSPARAGFDAGDGARAVLLWEGNTPESLQAIAHQTFWYTNSGGTPRPAPVVDMRIRQPGDGTWTGDDIYSADGAGQSLRQELTDGSVAVFELSVQNDGEADLAPIVRGPGADTGADVGWIVRYFDALTGGADITDLITGNEGWMPGTLAPGESREFRAEVAPIDHAPAGVGWQGLITAVPAEMEEILDNGEGSADGVMAVAVVPAQPDVCVRTAKGTKWIGSHVYTLDGRLQWASCAIGRGGTAVYHLLLRNDGGGEDAFVLRGTEGTAGWTVRYYDSLSNGRNITAQVTGPDGWQSSAMDPGESQTLRAEVTAPPGAHPSSRYIVRVRAFSVADGGQSDCVKARTSVAIKCRPDAMIRTVADDEWIGDDIYNKSGRRQTKQAHVLRGQTIVYFLQFQNDGNWPDGLTITGSRGNSSWRVRYYDGWTRGQDITEEVTQGGWSVPYLNAGARQPMRVEVTAKKWAIVRARKTVLVRATSMMRKTAQDVVKAVTIRRGGSIIGPLSAISSLSAIPTQMGVEIVVSLAAPAELSVRVLNVAGRPVRALCTGKQLQAGMSRLLWNATSDTGASVPAGTYLIEVRAEGPDGSQATRVTTVRIAR